MGDAQGDFPGGKLVEQDMAVLLPRMDKFDFRRNVLCAAQCIGGEGFFKIGIAVGRVVEAGDGFVEGGGRIILQLVLEFAQCLGHGAEVGFAADLLQTDGIFYKVVGTPCAAVCIQIASRPRQSWDDIQRFPCWVAALGKNFRPQMPGHAADILHQAHRVSKGICVDALQNKAFGMIFPPDHKGVVDMPLTIVVSIAEHRPAKIKGICSRLEQRKGNGFHHKFLVFVILHAVLSGRGVFPAASDGGIRWGSCPPPCGSTGRNSWGRKSPSAR